jgi:multidrug efflux pump subunit AcrA (membrane-fusion protein)
MASSLSKFIAGAAGFGANYLNMQIKEEILAKREARLNAFKSQEAQKDREYRSQEAEAARAAQAEENQSDRALKEQELKETAKYRQEQKAWQAEDRRLEQLYREAQLEQDERRTVAIEAERKAKRLVHEADLNNLNKRKELEEQFANPDLTKEAKSDILRSLSVRFPDDVKQEKITVKEGLNERDVIIVTLFGQEIGRIDPLNDIGYRGGGNRGALAQVKRAEIKDDQTD